MKFGFDGDNVPMENCIEFAAKSLDNANNEVRQAASDLVLEAYKLVGVDTIEPMLSSSQPANDRRAIEHQGCSHE